jgi:hypothetical protein
MPARTRDPKEPLLVLLLVSRMQALLPKRIVAMPWGRTDVGAFASLSSSDRATCVAQIGEVWFEPGSGEVLAKYLFTSQRLSMWNSWIGHARGPAISFSILPNSPPDSSETASDKVGTVQS